MVLRSAILDVNSIGESVQPHTPSPFRPWLRLVLGVLGAASFGAGVAAVFLAKDGPGAGVLIGFGGVVLVVALLGDAIESIEFGGGKLKMRAAAAERFALAEEAERYGDSDSAARLRAEARALFEASAGPIAASYRAVRSSMPAGPERTMAMEQVVADAWRLAQQKHFERSDVVQWLQNGSDEQRVTALALMQAKPELRDFDSVLAAIKHSRSPFEQYHALLLATFMTSDLDPRERRRLVEAVKQARRRFGNDTDRWMVSDQILRKIEPEQNPGQ
jgi:hypothetical protein